MKSEKISPQDPRLSAYAFGEMEPHEAAQFARLLAAEGAAVVLTGRTQAAVDASLARLQAQVPGAPPKAWRQTAPHRKAPHACSSRTQKGFLGMASTLCGGVQDGARRSTEFLGE